MIDKTYGQPMTQKTLWGLPFFKVQGEGWWGVPFKTLCDILGWGT